MTSTVEFGPYTSRPAATVNDLAAALTLAERELSLVPDVGSWMFLTLSRLRLPHWTVERRALVIDGLLVEPFAYRVDTGTWRWAEPAAHGEIEVVDRPRARTTADVLDRLHPDDHAALNVVLFDAARDEMVRRTDLRVLEDGAVVPVVMLTRGCRSCPTVDIDVVLGYAMAGPA